MITNIQIKELNHWIVLNKIMNLKFFVIKALKQILTNFIIKIIFNNNLKTFFNQKRKGRQQNFKYLNKLEKKALKNKIPQLNYLIILLSN